MKIVIQTILTNMPPIFKKWLVLGFIKLTRELESFGLILQNLNLICVIGTVETYLGFWGERLNFGITIAKIQPKVWERIRKRWREKMLNFGNDNTEIQSLSSESQISFNSFYNAN